MNGVPSSEVPFVGTVAGDPSDQNTVWWGESNLWLSTNQGTAWTNATASLASGSLSTVSAIGVVSTDGNTVILGDLNGSILLLGECQANGPPCGLRAVLRLKAAP